MDECLDKMNVKLHGRMSSRGWMSNCMDECPDEDECQTAWTNVQMRMNVKLHGRMSRWGWMSNCMDKCPDEDECQAVWTNVQSRMNVKMPLS